MLTSAWGGTTIAPTMKHSKDNPGVIPLHAPRKLHPTTTFEALVSWVEMVARDRGAPGMIIGVSGTDSVLAFLACARAYERLGRPGRVLGIHYGKPWPPPGKSEAEVARMLGLAPNLNWVVRTLLPWLRVQAPGAEIIVDDGSHGGSDPLRWADLIQRSLAGARPTEPLAPEGTYWVVGTRNATEDALLTYSNASSAVSLQPLMRLWKSEVLQICTHLGVPSIAIERSRQMDCDCGRFELAASHIDEVDAILMARAGLLDPAYLVRHVEASLLGELEDFVSQQLIEAAFKREIPYTPANSEIIRFS